MKMHKRFLDITILFALVLSILTGCSDMLLSGGGVEAGNPRVVGAVFEQTGAPATGTVVRLIPAGFIAAPGVAPENQQVDTTDSYGKYAFENVAIGSYTLQIKQLSNLKRALVRNVMAEKSRTTTVAGDTVRDAGILRIILPDSLKNAGGTIAILGTTYAVAINSSSPTGNILDIDSLPAGVMPSVVYIKNQTPGTYPQPLANDIVINPHDTVTTSALLPKKTLVQPGDDVQAAIDHLLPGDSLLLAGGIYEHTGISISSHGNMLQPIVIAAQPGQTPVMRITVATNNCINIDDAQWLTIDGITIDSTQSDIDGIKFTEFGVSHHVTVRNCTIHAVQGTGINAQGGHYSITISSNHIYDISGDAVTGIRVAPATTSSMPHDWIIADNWVHTIGDSLSSAAFGISLNTGCQSMTVRDNVVYTAGTSGILIYGLGDPQSSGTLSSIVEGNAVWDAPEGISAYCDVTVRNNIIFDCPNPVYSYSYSGAIPRNVLICNNTMYNGEAPYLRSWDSTNNCVFVNNAVYTMTGGFTLIGNGRIANNAGDVSAAGFITGSAATDLADPANRNFYPKPGSILIDRALPGFTPAADFNGILRDNLPEIGAYEFAGSSNPGWSIKEGFKGR
jgi:hypothetical protein